MINCLIYPVHSIDFRIRVADIYPNLKKMLLSWLNNQARLKPPVSFEIIAKEPVITFNSQVIHPEKGDDVCVSSFSQWGETYPEMVEAIVGFPFLKRLGKKILFDFRNMRMEVLE